MSKVCNIDINHLQKVYKELKNFIERLKSSLSIKEVYLYGSFAKGEIHEGSDIDLFIVGEIEGRIFERIDKVLKLTDLPVEPLVYTSKEFRKMKEEKNPFLTEALKTAKRLV